MNRRMLVAVSLVLSSTVASASVAAQEIRVATPMTWVTPDGSPELRHQLAIARMRAEATTPVQIQPSMQEVRLSSGAKTAIIVTAIVVGALLILGLVVLAKPGKHVP